MRTYARYGRSVKHSAERTDRFECDDTHLLHVLDPALVTRNERSFSLIRHHENLRGHEHHMSARKPRRKENHGRLATRGSGLHDIRSRLDEPRSYMKRSWKKVTPALPHRDECKVGRVPQFNRSTPSAHVSSLPVLRVSHFSA